MKLVEYLVATVASVVIVFIPLLGEQHQADRHSNYLENSFNYCVTED